MLASAFLTRLSYTLRGTDDDAPSWGDDEATYWIDTFNRLKDQLFEDVTKRWRFSHKETFPVEPGTVATTGTTTLTGTSTNFTDYNVGDKITVSGETVRTIDTIASDTSLTVTVAFSNTASTKTFTRSIIIKTGTTAYNLHRSFLAPSSKAYVINSSGQRLYLELIQPYERDIDSQTIHIDGDIPQIANFNIDIESTDAMVGGTLYIPGYFMPGDVNSASDNVPLPDANWGVMATAAEIAANDIIYEDKEANLNAKANNLYSLMVKKNNRGTYGTPRRTPVLLKRIRDTRS